MWTTNNEEATEKKLGRPKGSKDTFKRTQRTAGVELPESDLTALHYAIIQLLYTYRVLTSSQLLDLLVMHGLVKRGSTTYAQRVIRELFHAAYIFRDEIPQKPSEPRKPLVNWLDSRGAKALAQRDKCRVRDLDWKPGEHDIGSNKLHHMLLANRVKIHLLQSAQYLGLTISRWDDDRTIQRTHRDDTVMVRRLIHRVKPGGVRESEEEIFQTHYYPDAFCTIETPRFALNRFVEIDRNHEPIEASNWERSDISKKIACSLSYHRQGHFQRRYQARGFGVLTLTETDGRARNMAEMTQRVGGQHRFFYGTYTDFFGAGANAIITPLWYVAGADTRCAMIRAEDLPAPAAP